MLLSGDQAGYYVCLAFLIARCTRGEFGVRFVIMLTASHWAIFVKDFPCFRRSSWLQVGSFVKRRVALILLTMMAWQLGCPASSSWRPYLLKCVALPPGVSELQLGSADTDL